MARKSILLGIKSKAKPIKAGSTSRKHGGFPTQKIVQIRAKILTDIQKKKDG